MTGVVVARGVAEQQRGAEKGLRVKNEMRWKNPRTTLNKEQNPREDIFNIALKYLYNKQKVDNFKKQKSPLCLGSDF